MLLPPEFKRLCRGFNQAIDMTEITADELAMHALQFIEPSDVDVVKQTLNELTSDAVSDKELIDTWAHSPADIMFYDPSGLRLVLAAVLKRIDTHPYLLWRKEQTE